MFWEVFPISCSNEKSFSDEFVCNGLALFAAGEASKDNKDETKDGDDDNNIEELLLFEFVIDDVKSYDIKVEMADDIKSNVTYVSSIVTVKSHIIIPRLNPYGKFFVGGIYEAISAIISPIIVTQLHIDIIASLIMDNALYKTPYSIAIILHNNVKIIYIKTLKFS